jgi:hypothetical protein
MSDDRAGLALREHLGDVLADVMPRPTLLDDIHAAHQRRLRRRASLLAAGSALTVAAATAAVLWTTTTTGGHGLVRTKITPAASPSYGPPKPLEEWFTSSFPLARPTGEIVAIPLSSDVLDPADSKRSLVVWYNAGQDVFCSGEVVQDRDHPDGWRGAGGGASCTDNARHRPWASQITSGASNCQGTRYWFGVIGVDAPKVEVTGVGGPDPTLTLRGLEGAPSPFFVVTDIKAPAVLFRYLDAHGKLVRQVTDPTHHAPDCGPLPVVPTPTPSG